MKWIKAKSIDQNIDNDKIMVGDKIRIYGEEREVTGFYASYNDGIEKWETIILTTGRGDPFERSLDVIEIQKKLPNRYELPGQQHKKKDDEDLF